MAGDLLAHLKIDQLVEVWDDILKPLNFVSQMKGILLPDSICIVYLMRECQHRLCTTLLVQ